MSDIKLEFVVRMTCIGCEEAVKRVLENTTGISSVFADHKSERVIVKTSLNSGKVQQLIESTGRQAVLQGLGSGKGESLRGLGAAVSIIEGSYVRGVTRLIQTDNDNCVIEGTLDGLKPGKHQLKIHEFGDLSKGCNSCGDVFQPPFAQNPSAYGFLGDVEVAADGRAEFRLQSSDVKVWDIIGRSVVVHDFVAHQRTGDGRVGCGIIARSSGLFENNKRICACDGVTIWDEKKVPAAGAKRSEFVNQQANPAASSHL